MICAFTMADFEKSFHTLPINIISSFVQFFFIILSKSIINMKFVSCLNHMFTVIFPGRVPRSFLVWSQRVDLWACCSTIFSRSFRDIVISPSVILEGYVLKICDPTFGNESFIPTR